MKAFLLAAGQGTRLRPLTDRTPKCLLPIRGRPLLRIWFDLCRAHGIREVRVNLHSHAEAVREFVRHNSDGLEVDLSAEPVLLGSAGTLRANRAWVESEPFFWVLYADVLTGANLSEMAEFHRLRKGAATLATYSVRNPSQCGIATVDETGLIHDFVEKPTNPSGNLAFAGLLIGTPALLDAIPPRGPADLGFDVLPRLVGRMYAFPISEYVVDIGTIENYTAAQSGWPE